MRQFTANRWVAGAILLLVALSMVPMGAAVEGDCGGESEALQQICELIPQYKGFEGMSEQQIILFGFVLPFLLVFAIFHYLLGRMMGGRESSVIALVLAAFFMGSGSYKVLAGFLLDPFGLATGGPSLPGSDLPAGEVEDFCQLAGTLPVLELFACWEAQLIVAMVFGVIMGLILNSGLIGNKGWDTPEFVMLILGTGAFWFAIGGAEQLSQVILWLIVFGVGFGLLSVWAETSGFAGSIAGFAGLMVIAWGLTQVGGSPLVPEQAAAFGDMILQGLASVVILIILLGVGVVVALVKLR